MAKTTAPERTLVELRALTHEIASALMNVATAAILLQSAGFQDPQLVGRTQVLLNEINRTSDLLARQRVILQGRRC